MKRVILNNQDVILEEEAVNAAIAKYFTGMYNGEETMEISNEGLTIDLLFNEKNYGSYQ